MDKIPITFEYKGKSYQGTFEAVHGGGGANIWHLTIGNYYCGRLRLNDTEGWTFDENSFGAKELTDYFAAVVMAWYE
jgi:hypothetical protein